MLSDPERRTLRDMECRLVAEDPTWAALFTEQQRRLDGSPRPGWLRYALMVGIALASTLAAIAIFVGVASLAAVAIAVTAVLSWVLGHPGPSSRSDRPHDDQGRPRA